MAEPVMDSSPATNIYTEHEFGIRVTHGAGTVSTIRCREIVVARPSATTLTLTFPKTYAEVTNFTCGWLKATGVDPVQYQITTNAINTTGVVTLTSVSTNSAGVATAPANGDVCYIRIGVSCDTLNDRFVQTTA